MRSGTRLEGPCYVGPGARVLGGYVRASILGPAVSVVRGEVSSTIFNGYANKAHDGFVGHSVIGHWVNLGAGTTTSNLKNTYGTVRLDGGRARTIDTGRQFLGSLIGDHAKTAIGTMLPTGTVVGAGANVFGGGLGKYVPPFSWGASGDVQLTEDGFLRIAERVHAAPRRGGDGRAPRVAHRDLPPTVRAVTTSLIALGSGSRGNCFALECEGAVLLIDAGFSAKEITRRAERAGIDLGGLVGVALTHEHGDHAVGRPRGSRRDHGAPVLTSPGHVARARPSRATRAQRIAPSGARSGWRWGPSPCGARRSRTTPRSRWRWRWSHSTG